MSLTIWDICDRAIKGPLMKESEFDRILSKRAAEIVKEHDIKYNPEEIVSTDNTLADDVWKAGVDLFLDMGVYCLDTERIIKISEDELKEVIKDKALSKFSIGKGRDARTLIHREVEDKRPLIVCGGPCGTAISEDILPKFMQAYIQEPIDIFGCPTVPTVNGVAAIAGAPSEIRATMCEAIWAKQAARLAGKQGIHIQGATTAINSQAAIAAFFLGGLEKTDAMGVNLLPCLKTDYNALSKIAYCNDYGYFLMLGSAPILGSVGGPEVSAIVAVALALESIAHSYTKSTYVAGYMTDLKYACTSRRNTLWAHSLSTMAISRNACFLNGNGALYTIAGPCTEMAFYETATKTIEDVVSGHDLEYGVGTCCGIKENYATPMETRLIVDINQAAAGIKRTDANEIVKKILAKYEDKLENPPMGKSFTECYDIKTLKPTNEYIELYKKVINELEDLGLEFE